MKVLITGGTGFVGTALLKAIKLNPQYEVALVVRQTQAHNDFKTIDCSQCDWTDEVVKWNPNVIIHLAAAFTNRSDKTQIDNLIESNILFTTKLAETASRCNDCIAFVNTGTFVEYLEGAGIEAPCNLYAATKAAVRPILQYYSNKAGWKWINVIVYSPYGRKNRSKKVIDYLLDALGSETPIDFSPGLQVLDFIHVDDMARFYLALLSKIDSLPGGYTQLHLGTGEGHTLREVASTLERLSGKKLNANWGGRNYSTEDPMHAVAPMAKTFRLLDWRPQETLESGLKILLADTNI